MVLIIYNITLEILAIYFLLQQHKLIKDKGDDFVLFVVKLDIVLFIVSNYFFVFIILPGNCYFSYNANRLEKYLHIL